MSLERTVAGLLRLIRFRGGSAQVRLHAFGRVSSTRWLRGRGRTSTCYCVWYYDVNIASRRRRHRCCWWWWC